MKTKILLILLTLSFFPLAAETAQAQRKKPVPKKPPAAAQTDTGPLKLEAILKALRTKDGLGGFKNLAERTVYIISEVKPRGVAFVLTPASEGELRAAGANDELIAAIRKANEGSAVAIKKTGEDVKRSADAHRAKGEFDAAIKDYTSAIEEYKLDQDADIYYGRGIAYYFKGNYASALSDLGRAIALKPGNVDAYKYRGLANLRRGNYDMAITDFDKMIASEPNNAEAYNNRGLAYTAKGSCELAMRDYNKAIRERTTFAEAYSNRGVCQHRLGDRDGAIKDFDEAIKHNSDLAEAWYNRGMVLFDKGNHTDALAQFERAVQLNKNYAPAYYGIGLYYSKKEKPDLAIDNYSKAVKIMPNLAEAWFNRGKEYFSSKEDYNQAASDFRRALDLDPTNKEYRENWEKAQKKARKN